MHTVETNMEDSKSDKESNIYESLNGSTVSSDNISSSIDEKQNMIEDLDKLCNIHSSDYDTAEYSQWHQIDFVLGVWGLWECHFLLGGQQHLRSKI